MNSIRTGLISFLGLLLMGGMVRAQGPVDQARINEQIDKEKAVQRETDLAVRRIATMLSVLEFYGVEAPERTKLLEDVAGSLAKLSKGQMNDVIDRLSAAGRAGDPKKSAAEAIEAYSKHDEIIKTLRRMTGAMEALRGLEQAAHKLEDLAKRQQKVYLITHRVLRLEEEKKQLFPRQLAAAKAHTLAVDTRIQAGEQTNVDSDVKLAIAGIRALAPDLPTEQQERVRTMEKRLAEMQLLDHVALAANKLRSVYGAQMMAEWTRANEMQKEAARDLLELASLLRPPQNSVEERQNAIAQLNEAIARQDDLQKQTMQQQARLEKLAREEQAARAEPEPPPPPPTAGLGFEAENPNKIKDALTRFAELEKNDPSLALQFASVKQQLQDRMQEMHNARPDYKKLAAEQKKLEQQSSIAEKIGDISREQSRLELDAARIRNQAEPNARGLTAAEKDMQSARNALDMNQLEGAAAKQKDAAAELRKVRDELQRQLDREIQERDAMEVGKIDPRQPRDQVAQALKGAREASQEINKAREQAKEQAPQDLTETLARARERNEEAQSALDQVPHAPKAVRDQLKNAADSLQKAQKEIAQGKPEDAAQSQARAEENLEKALSALTEAVKQAPSQARPKPSARPGKGRQDAPGAAESAGRTAGKSAKKDKAAAREMNSSAGEGNREAREQGAGSAASQLKEVMGDSAFLSLPPREREMIRQSLLGRLPPEYAAEIQQYFINVARGRAAPSVPLAPTGQRKGP